jgi:hypothetical protein
MVVARKNTTFDGNSMEFSEDLLKLNPEKPIDFKSLKENGFDLEQLFNDQGWKKYFDLLNGPIYTELIKLFWMNAYVYNEAAAKLEEKQLIEKHPELQGKSRRELGLDEFVEDEIRSTAKI